MELLHGTLDVMVLKALAWGPRHGYDVVRWIRSRSGGHFEIEEGALYRSLHRMEERQWLRAEWGRSENGRRAKFYELTVAGERALRAQSEGWTEYAEAVSSVLGSEEAKP